MRLAPVVVAFAVAVLSSAGLAHAGAAEPSGAHPRMLLDADLRAAWREQAKLPHGPVVGSIRLCDDARLTSDHDRAVYQGSEWARVVQACLVAWAATDNPDHAKTALRFFRALLDDRDVIGDRQGGDESARRDSGYAIRMIGPYTALAYDWLHDVPGMTPELRAHARARWKAWLDWYRRDGYRANDPGTNYHAGYLIAATTMAIAQGGEAGEEGTRLWREVADKMWGKDMAIALGTEGILAGGDWPEGWQYGPLSVAEYALGARVMRGVGVPVPGIEGWLDAMFRRHVYALSPADGVYAGGDTEDTVANLAPNVLTLDAIALGDASPETRRWARGELVRLQLTDKDWLLYDALAAVGDKPVLAPRSSWPTWYVAAGTGTLFARTRWDDRAVWFVMACQHTIEADHRHPDTGNFVLSRGRDDVIVDPSPYGSQSTLTSNAPTVASGQLPGNYIPSQGFWGQKSGFDLVTQRASGVVAARCDYSDQYRFQDRRSDVPDALRDVVLVPSTDGRDAVLIVADRASTGAAGRGMYLRFHTPAHLALDGDTATGTVGSTRLVISSVGRSSGTPAIGVPRGKDCYGEDTVRGRCEAARFPSTDYRVELAGPSPRAIHILGARAATAPPAKFAQISGEGWTGVRVSGVRDAVVVWRTGEGEALHYRAPRMPGVMHVIFDAPERGGKATLTAKPDGDSCAVDVAPGGTTPALPVIVSLDASCQITVDPEAAAVSAAGTHPTRPHHRSARSGCCGAQTTPGSPIAMTLVVLGIVLRRRRRVA